MANLVCAQCRRTCGTDGTSKGTKFVACSSCMQDIIRDKEILTNKVKQLESKLHVDSMIIKNLRYNLNTYDPSFKLDED